MACTGHLVMIAIQWHKVERRHAVGTPSTGLSDLTTLRLHILFKRLRPGRCYNLMGVVLRLLVYESRALRRMFGPDRQETRHNSIMKKVS
jgi:hypothetical protein